MYLKSYNLILFLRENIDDTHTLPFFRSIFDWANCSMSPEESKEQGKSCATSSVGPNQTIIRVPLTELHPFPNHTYGIRDDQAMQDTADSMKQSGVVVPAIVRPDAEGGYEIVAEQRRKLAS